MIRRTIGIVDYGVGNHASVRWALQSLGYRCRVSSESTVLQKTDLLLLPGVGAFAEAMNALHAVALVEFIQEQARAGKPLIGLCLGMQLLADTSQEFGMHAGLGLVPGQVVALREPRWHIGWNSIEVRNTGSFLQPSDGRTFYFNHSYEFDAPSEYQACVACVGKPVTVGIQRDNVVGFQFHPEKSQQAGWQLLQNTVEGLCS
jgi:glutamine amidotransferase